MELPELVPVPKFCIFCGKPPERKSREHVIPQWLIEMTGDPKRKARFGPIWDNQANKLYIGEFAFNQFQFPACSNCNTARSAFETQAKGIMEGILNENALSSQDIGILFSWLDKVRIGLWLGFYYYRRQISDIEPHMFIDSRIDQTDRLMFIYRSSSSIKRVNFSGVGTPLFDYHPICFTLLVNNYAFFNISTDFLISRRLGLPYPYEAEWGEWPGMIFHLSPGRERITLPIIRRQINTRCTQIYQPMFTRSVILEDAKELYDTEYVRSMSANLESGVGKIYIDQNRSIREYSPTPSMDWIPESSWDWQELERAITKQTLEFQIELLKLQPSYRSLDSNRTIMKAQMQLARDINRMMLKYMRLD